MKKAEAISILATSVRPREAKDRARYDEAVKMAIEALKSSEIPKSSEQNAETAQPDHIADSDKMADGDCISRQAAIDALDIAIERYDEIAEKYRKKADIERNDYMDMRDNAYEAQQLAQWLNELKYLREKIEQITIKTEPKWIPISKETNPTKSGWYLVTVHEDATNDNERFTEMAEFNAINGMWYDIDEPTDMYLRWMPLPAPYRGGDE